MLKRVFLFAVALFFISSVAFAAAFCLATSRAFAAEPTPTMVGMANPNVTYPSIALAERKVGFAALSIQPKSDYVLQNVNVIANEVVELTYTNHEQQKLVIRTAKFNGSNKNISGIYGAKWRDENIGCLYMHLTRFDKLCAAYWNDKDYTYAVIGTGYTERAFFEVVAPMYMSINPEP